VKRIISARKRCRCWRANADLSVANQSWLAWGTYSLGWLGHNSFGRSGNGVWLGVFNGGEIRI
jgi:hypothetical protein